MNNEVNQTFRKDTEETSSPVAPRARRTEFEIPEYRLSTVLHKIEVLNRRAAKLGCAPVAVEILGEVFADEFVFADGETHFVKRSHEAYAKTCEQHSKTGAIRVYKQVRITGEAPKYDGWTFVATLTKTEVGNLISKSPKAEVELNHYRTVEPVCEHCKLERNRRETFIVLHDSGTLKQVGRQCIRDFLGHHHPENLAARAEWEFSFTELLGESEDYEGGSGGGDHLIGVGAFLRHAAQAILTHGFTSKANAELYQKNSTKEDAIASLFPPRGIRVKRVEITPEAEKLASEAQAHVLATLGAKSPETLSDFEHNLLLVCKREAVESRALGILAFVPEYYRRETEKAVRREKAAAESKHFGTEGVRTRKALLTFLRTRGPYESQFGSTFYHHFLTEDGAEVIWKTGTGLDYEAGHAIRADFTVKKHEDWNGRKQTKISRLTVKEEIGKLAAQ